MEYKQNMNTIERTMNAMIDDFFLSYDDLVLDAKLHLGSLFDPSDYPSIHGLRDKFGFKLVFSPLPESNDFRLDIPQQEMQELSGKYESAFNDRLNDAMQENWSKLHKTLTHMSEKLTETEDENSVKRYHDSLVTNATELCGLLTHLNITKDPKLEEARRSLELTMLGVGIEDIKDSPVVRSNVKNKVDEILNKFNW
jgi:hypothetical protein